MNLIINTNLQQEDDVDIVVKKNTNNVFEITGIDEILNNIILNKIIMLDNVDECEELIIYLIKNINSDLLNNISSILYKNDMSIDIIDKILKYLHKEHYNKIFPMIFNEICNYGCIKIVDHLINNYKEDININDGLCIACMDKKINLVKYFENNNMITYDYIIEHINISNFYGRDNVKFMKFMIYLIENYNKKINDETRKNILSNICGDEYIQKKFVKIYCKYFPIDYILLENICRYSHVNVLSYLMKKNKYKFNTNELLLDGIKSLIVIGSASFGDSSKRNKIIKLVFYKFQKDNPNIYFYRSVGSRVVDVIITPPEYKLFDVSFKFDYKVIYTTITIKKEKYFNIYYTGDGEYIDEAVEKYKLMTNKNRKKSAMK